MEEKKMEKEKVLQKKHIIKEFSKKSLPKIYKLIEIYGSERNIVIFKSREETNAYFEKLGEQNDL